MWPGVWPKAGIETMPGATSAPGLNRRTSLAMSRKNAPRIEEIAQHRRARGHVWASSIQKAHSGSGTKISALANTLSPSLVLMPSMWSGWKCEMRMVSIAGRDAGGGEIGEHDPAVSVI